MSEFSEAVEGEAVIVVVALDDESDPVERREVAELPVESSSAVDGFEVVVEIVWVDVGSVVSASSAVDVVIVVCTVFSEFDVTSESSVPPPSVLEELPSDVGALKATLK